MISPVRGLLAIREHGESKRKCGDIAREWFATALLRETKSWHYLRVLVTSGY